MKDSIVQTGNLVLRKIAKPIAKKDLDTPVLKALVKKMQAALAAEEFGVALAAPQVGVSLRLFVVSKKVFTEREVGGQKSGRARHDGGRGDPRTFGKQFPAELHTVFINPEITRLSRKKREMSEGCLSVRGKYGTVMRHEKASIKAQDEHGKEFVYHASGLLAHIFQHECDHLKGMLYTDLAIKLQDDDSRIELRTKFPA